MIPSKKLSLTWATIAFITVTKSFLWNQNMWTIQQSKFCLKDHQIQVVLQICYVK